MRNKVVGKNTRKGSNLKTGRKYSYDKEYQKSPEQVKNRVARNKARRQMTKTKGRAAMRGKDVDHKRPLSRGGSNSKRNLRLIPAGKNRARK